MALTPDEIERRTFPIADWGYDRGEVHKFLVEVAATLRYAQHSSVGGAPTAVQRPFVQGSAQGSAQGSVQEPVQGPAPATAVTAPDAPATRVEIRPEVAALVTAEGRADYAKLGVQVTQILEAAETLATGLQADAEQSLLVARADAEQVVADRLREAEDEATQLREHAKRVLKAAQEQAERIMAEAEDHAAAVRTAADQRSKARNERLQRVAQQHAERVLRFERDAVTRLHEAQEDLQRSIERLTGSEHSPVLDLSKDQPAVRVGSIDVPLGEPEAEGPAFTRPTDRGQSKTSAADPVNRLVRAAVERAVENSTNRNPGGPKSTRAAAVPVPAEPAPSHAAAPQAPAAS